MSYNQGALRGYNISEGIQSEFSDDFHPEVYHIIIVSQNEHIHATLSRTLEHFSLNSRSINVLHAGNLHEARVLVEKNKETILVVIDNNVQVNGSYSVFVDYVQNQLKNNMCHITFKENLIRPGQKNSIPIDGFDKKELNEFLNARDRLIEITRMIMMTTEMENKIEEKDLENESFDNPENKPADYRITRDRLYSILAHDLKGPVGNIKVMLEFLTNEPELLDQDSSKDLLFRVRESAESVHELLEDFLFWSRMIKQDVYFNPSKVDLDLVIRENILLLKSVAAAKDIALSYEIDEEAFTYADEYMLHTIIRNLLYNAIKFTECGGHIEISTKEFEHFHEVVVRDNGVGIPSEGIEKIFRSDVVYSTNGTSMEGGTGLGLILCRDFVEKNGGEIWVESEENKGSTFRFTLPKWK
ncbi:MAG: HAMP domain-containing histidine kinase [Bacteroidetes bacterium]|nr:HAMP domain-containing histidine kinase [Bacteroidota bacterium]